MDARLNHKNKVAFSNFYGVVYALSKSAEYSANAIKPEDSDFFFSGSLL